MVKTGVAFGDYILKGSQKRKNWDYEGKKRSSRDLFLPLIFAVLFIILFSRLFFVQVINGYYYRYLSDNNRTKTVTIHSPRGIIFDRKGEPLVFNIPGYRENIKGKTVLLSQNEALNLIADGKKGLEIDSLRQYPNKETFSHVLGYTGQISEKELKSSSFSSYNSGDIIGKAGIEQQYEQKLRGTDGKELYEIDASGNLVRKLGQQEPIPGQNITLTLDLKLQKAAYEAAKDVKKGSIIVSTPKGEILALISKPSFDPNLFTMGEGYKLSTSSSYLTLTDILSDNINQPLLDRSIAGVYPPGSTFKLLVAASGLENNIIDENYEVEDTGVLRVGAFSFSNWFFTGYGRTDGNVNVVKGISRSNDIFFYKLAEKVGVDKISEMSLKFNLGKNLGIDLQGEAQGTVPTQKWKKDVIGEPWYLGDTFIYGIGQGYLLTTPLQVNAFTQAIANSGTLYRPYLLKDLGSKKLSSGLLESKSFDLIRNGMVNSCSTGGVAWPFFDFKVKNKNLKVDGKNILDVPISSGSADTRKIIVACKTGTAQHGGEKTLPHAWITLFAPAYNPEIIITVLSEESGEGSSVAGPIAKKILESYFSNR